MHEGHTGPILAAPQVESITDKEDDSTRPTQGEGRVKKMVAKLEKVSSASHVFQPASLYTSVTMPLEVWAIPNSQGCYCLTLLYKVPQTHPCDVLLNFPDSETDEEEALAASKVEPHMVPLLEKVGIKLRKKSTATCSTEHM